MREFESFSVEQSAQSIDAASVDTMLEVELLSGGVGFDDETEEDKHWIQEELARRKDKMHNK